MSPHLTVIILEEAVCFRVQQIFKSPPDEADVADTKGNMGASHNSETLLNTSMSRHNVGNHNSSQARPASAISATGREGAAWGPPQPRIYANQAPVHPSRMGTRPRPIQVFNPSTESELRERSKAEYYGFFKV